MDNSTMLLALHELEGVGWKTIDRVVRCVPELEELTGMSEAAFRSMGLTAPRAELLHSRLNKEYIKRIHDKYSRGFVAPVTRLDDDYPALLQQTAQPPWVLYGIGNRKLLGKPAIAVVGTRLPTVYGKRMAERFSKELSQAGICVVSGLAKGIDGCAHQGAIAEEGSTIAVLGCGVDVMYPREHAYLYREIAEKGLILSEYPPGTAAAPGLFPQRNRIIAGMTLGTLVVEADVKSGSLITTDYALDESRDVFALPGPITSPKSLGTNGLIQKGAKLVMDINDVLGEYIHVIGDRRNIGDQAANNRHNRGKMTGEETKVLEILAQGPATIDELIERLQTNFGHLHAILLSLLLKKAIEQLPGSVYVLI